MEEAKNSLDLYIDLDEYKGFKNLLRFNGVKQSDIDKKNLDRSAASSANGTKIERHSK